MHRHTSKAHETRTARPAHDTAVVPDLLAEQGRMGLAGEWLQALANSDRGRQPHDPTGVPGAPGPTVDPMLCAGPSEFAAQFNQTFSSVLHAFAPGRGGAGDPAACAPGLDSATSAQQTPRGRSGVDLDDPRLALLFTPVQRVGLMSYCKTGEIPDRLFDGDESGGTTAQQRILMSALILTEGHYRPHSHSQRVHAKMCFHWAHLVHHYAGATPDKGPLADGVMGATDHAGLVVFGTGGAATTRRGERVAAPERKASRQVQAEAARKAYEDAIAAGEKPSRLRTLQVALRKADRGAEQDYIRHTPLDAGEFQGLEPGDWIYYHNDNSSRSGDHSVIFSRWLNAEQSSETDDGEQVLYRHAECFSQGSPGGGGRQHTAWLGTKWTQVGDIRVHPVTRVSRVPADRRPARTVDELLPLPTHLRRAPGEGASEKERAQYEKRLTRYTSGIEAKNAKFIKKAARGQSYDEARLLAAVERWIRTRNRQLIDQLGERITEGQRGMLIAANAQPSLLVVTRLNERLSGVGTNIALTERGEATQGERYDAAYDLAVERWRGAVTKALDPLETRLTDARDVLEAAEPEMADNPKVSTARQLVDDDVLADVLGQIGELRASDPTRTIEDEQSRVEAIGAAIADLEPSVPAARVELFRARPRPAAFRAADRPLRHLASRINTFQRTIRSAERDAPYISAHGSARGGSSARTTGLLENVPDVPWADLLSEARPA